VLLVVHYPPDRGPHQRSDSPRDADWLDDHDITDGWL
jgi:hypothetical protein